MMGVVKVRFWWWLLSRSSATVLPDTLVVIVEVLIVVFVRQTLPTTVISVLVLVFFFGDRMTVPQVRTTDIFDDVTKGWCDRLASVNKRITRAERWSATAAVSHETRSGFHGSKQRVAEVGYGEILVVGWWLVIGQSTVRVPADFAVMLRVVRCVWSVLDGLYSDALLFFGFATQTATHAFIPFNHAGIWVWRKAWSRQYLRKRLTRVWVLDVPFLDRLSQEFRVFVRTQKKLHSLPHDPSFNLESGDNWVSIAVA
jgi:hypothetical protein